MGATGHGMDFLAIREGSADRLGRWKLSDPGTLPLHHDEDFEWVRDAAAVVSRCHAIAAALALTHRAPVKTVRAAIDDHDLERWMGHRELDLLHVLEDEIEIDEQALQRLLVDIAWREEALLALLWSVRIVDELAPDQMCPKEPVYEKLAPGLDPARARTDLRLRPLAEIAAMLDFYYCLHWHARSAQYHGEIWDYQIAPGVVLERRRALEWLFQDVPWEEVDLGA
jgi:hypothetical protein